LALDALPGLSVAKERLSDSFEGGEAGSPSDNVDVEKRLPNDLGGGEVASFRLGHAAGLSVSCFGGGEGLPDEPDPLRVSFPPPPPIPFELLPGGNSVWIELGESSGVAGDQPG